MLENSIVELRHYLEFKGNPRPSERILYPEKPVTRSLAPGLEAVLLSSLLSLLDRMMEVLPNDSRASTENELETLSVLRSLSTQLRTAEATITPMDAFNAIAWWLYLDMIEPRRSADQIKASVQEFLDATVDRQLTRVHELALEFQEHRSALVTGMLSLRDRKILFRTLNQLDCESSITTQVLTRQQASTLLDDLEGCVDVAGLLADNLLLIQGRNRVLETLRRIITIRDLVTRLHLFSSLTIQQAIGTRGSEVAARLPQLSKDAVVYQFLAAAQAPPYSDSPPLLHSLLHFARVFGHLQREKGDAVKEFFRETLPSFTMLLQSYPEQDLNQIFHSFQPLASNPGLIDTPFGYAYHLASAVRVLHGQSDTVPTDKLAAICVDIPTMVNACKHSEMHLFCKSVVGQFIGRFGDNRLERSWKGIGFIASSDCIGDELTIAGYDEHLGLASIPPDIVGASDSHAVADGGEKVAGALGADESTVWYLGSEVRHGPHVLGEYDTTHFEKGYPRFRKQIKNWTPFEDFIATVADAIMEARTKENEIQGAVSVHVGDTDIILPDKSMSLRLEKKFDPMVGYLIGRRLILAVSKPSTSRRMLAKCLGFGKEVGALGGYLSSCWLRNSDFNRPYESARNRKIEGELAWLGNYRGPSD